MPAEAPDYPSPSSERVTPFLIYLLFFATLGPLQFGYHLGELNAPESVIRCEVRRLPTYDILGLPQCIHMSNAQWGMIQSLFTIGGLIGALFSGPIATRWGRLFALRLLTFFLAGGPIAEALAGRIWVLALGRAISGVGAGAATVVAPIYISEISPNDKRGLFGAFTQVQINFGIVVAQLLGYFLSKDSKWRWILATAGFVAAFAFFGLLFANETPTWLASKNQPRAARTVLQRLRGRDADIRAEVDTWHISGAGEQEPLLGHKNPAGTTEDHLQTKSFLDVVRIQKYRRAVVAVSASMVAQQLTGINAVIMYSVSILGGIMPHKAALVTIIVSAANVAVTLLFSPLPDKVGRRKTLLASIMGMGIASCLLADGLSRNQRPLTIVGVALFVCSFGLGLGPVPFILASELVGPEAVGATSSWALALNWLSTFLVAQFVPILNAQLPPGHLFWIFAGISTFFYLLLAFLVPESKGMANADQVWSNHRGGFVRGIFRSVRR
ncbi:hypothetical protein PV10_02159 [Exophiala mesophila]|uniref:Major facilitator superfamily (MFS) profile domain-containing protein n=1 Tax=Exophiala mesophila TaxID=212818 RepID=A0A0D1ZIG3_EXOME|nr:uncharacterized protein PV10_02159 [Exophiala mesophila]KIV94387.1 hypothetical protein PV10_02159 [Exophiala mesophila]